MTPCLPYNAGFAQRNSLILVRGQVNASANTYHIVISTLSMFARPKVRRNQTLVDGVPHFAATSSFSPPPGNLQLERLALELVVRKEATCPRPPHLCAIAFPPLL